MSSRPIWCNLFVKDTFYGGLFYFVVRCVKAHDKIELGLSLFGVSGFAEPTSLILEGIL